MGGGGGPGGPGGLKMRVGFRFTPKGAELAVGTPHNHPHVTPRDHHGTIGFWSFGVVKKLLRVVGAKYLLST